MGDKVAAIRDRGIALQLDDRTDAEVMDMKIDHLVVLKEYEKAHRKIEEAISMYPGNIRFKTKLARVYYHLGDLDSARVKFDEGVRVGASDGEAYGARAEFRLKTGDPLNATQDFTKSLEENDVNPHTYVGRGESFLMTGKYEPAWEDLNKALTFDGKLKKALLLRALASERRGNTSSALQDYATILALLTEKRDIRTFKDLMAEESDEDHKYYFFEAHMKSGIICTKQRDFAGAIQHYNEVLKVKPRSFKALLHRGLAFHSHGYHDSGISDYTNALVIEPGHTTALQNRARAYAFQKHWTLAISDIEGIRGADRDAESWALLAKCYSMIDHRTSALEAVNTSLQLDGLSIHALVRSSHPCPLVAPYLICTCCQRSRMQLLHLLVVHCWVSQRFFEILIEIMMMCVLCDETCR